MNNITISIENLNGEFDSLVLQLKEYSDSYKNIQSCTGLEIATFILSVGNFVVALAALPQLVYLLNKKKIIVKFGGVKLGDSVDNILETLKSNPVFLEEIREAMANETFEVEGKGEAVGEFRKKFDDYFVKGAT